MVLTDENMLIELRKSTADLIEYDSVSVAMVRQAWERTAAGGTRKVGTPATLATKDRFFGEIITDPRQVITEQGEQLVCNRVLVGLYTDDIQEGDTFTYGGDKFLVAEVNPDHSFETRAYVVHRS